MKLNKQTLRVISTGLVIIALLAAIQEKIGIKIDNTVVVLIGLAVLVYILPEITNLSKFKYGDVEIEFEKKVDQLEKLVLAEEIIGGATNNRLENPKVHWQDYYSEYKEILLSTSPNNEKIIRAVQLTELMIIEAGKDFGIEETKQTKNPAIIMRELHKNGLITVEELALYNEFISLRNNIIHGKSKDISNNLTARILDLLWRIVRIFG